MILTLNLPPSVNKAYYHNMAKHQTFYGKEAKLWFEIAELQILNWRKLYKITGIIEEFTYLDLVFWLPRKNCDSHNYKKVLFDGLERFGVVSNDKYILDRTQAIYYDNKNPRVQIIIIPCN